MATSASSLLLPQPEHEEDSALDLNLSLGGLFSLPRSCPRQINCSYEVDVPLSPTLPAENFVDRMKLSTHHHLLHHNDSVKRRRDLHLQATNINQTKRSKAALDHHVQISFCNSSGDRSEAKSSKPTRNPEHSTSLRSDTSMNGYDVPSSRSHCMLLDMKKAAVTPRDCALVRPNQLETPPSGFVSGSHSPTVSCTSGIHTQTTPSNSQFIHNPTQKAASCHLSSSLNLIMAPSLPSADASTLETGSSSVIDHMLPTMKKSSIEDEEGKICHSITVESESGDNPDEERTSRKKAEAPGSRSGSNSDMMDIMNTLAAKSSTSSMMCMHPSAMLPVQGPFSLPFQWNFTSYAMHYSSTHMVPPHTSLPWIPYVPDSTSGLRPDKLAASCNEGKLQSNRETSSKEDALIAPRSSKNEDMQEVSQITELACAIANKTMPWSGSEVCTSASLLQPPFSTSPTGNCSSDACTSPWQPLTSATSPVTSNYSSNPCKHDPAKEDSGVNASNSSPTPEGCLKSVLRPQKSNDSGPVGNKLWGQSGHSMSSGRKPTKTVRFCCDERQLVQSTTSKNQMHKSSFSLRRSGRVCESNDQVGNSYKNQLVKKLQALRREEALCKRVRRNAGNLNSTTKECEQEESANSRVTSESSDQDESVLEKVELGGRAETREAKSPSSNLPRVSTTCTGPNGKTIHGVMYITENKQACLICSCHGMHMSPSEFVQHSGSTDLRNPERSIVVTGLSCVKQVV